MKPELLLICKYITAGLDGEATLTGVLSEIVVPSLPVLTPVAVYGRFSLDGHEWEKLPFGTQVECLVTITKPDRSELLRLQFTQDWPERPEFPPSRIIVNLGLSPIVIDIEGDYVFAFELVGYGKLESHLPVTVRSQKV